MSRSTNSSTAFRMTQPADTFIWLAIIFTRDNTALGRLTLRRAMAVVVGDFRVLLRFNLTSPIFTSMVQACQALFCHMSESQIILACTAMCVPAVTTDSRSSTASAVSARCEQRIARSPNGGSVNGSATCNAWIASVRGQRCGNWSSGSSLSVRDAPLKPRRPIAPSFATW
jgi:hypothetical protein